MKHVAILLLTFSLLAGCGEQKQSQRSAPSTSGRSKPVAHNTMTLPRDNPDRPVTGLVTDSDPAQFARMIREKTELANRQANELEFDQASHTWREILDLLVDEYGAGSWQCRNARIALETSEVQAGFSAEKLERLKVFRQLQSNVGAALRKPDVKKARELSAASSRLTAELFGADSFMAGKQLMQLARMNQQAGSQEAATMAYLRSLEILEKFIGDDHPDMELAYSYLGENYLVRGNLTEAIRHYTTSVAISKKVWGDRSLRYAARANDLGVAFQRASQPDSAVRFLRAAESIRRERLGEHHPQVGHSLMNLGMVYLDMERAQIADQCLTQAHEIFVQHYGQANELTADCKLKLATTSMLTGKPARAEQFLSDLLDAVEDQTDPGPVSLLQYRLAVALSRQGKYAQAEPLFRKALQAQRSTMGSGHKSTLETMQAYALLLKQNNRPGEADELYAEISQLVQPADGGAFRR